MLRCVCCVLAMTVMASGLRAAEIDYLEDFALARNRDEALKQLIPGSESHYYYQALYHQQQQQFEQVDELLKPWITRYGHTPRVVEIQLRQALLTYEKNPQQSLEILRRHLKLTFQHQREVLGEKPNLPSELDPQLISRERLTKGAMTGHSNLDGFEDSALEWLVTDPLDADRRRHLLQRLQRPDYPNLVKLVVDDLNHVQSQGFGSLNIHMQLLLPQLDECLKLKLDLLNQQKFVQAYLSKLQPNVDSDWRNDPQEKEAYFDRLWAFVQRLAPVHNSLKAHVLYHRLVHDRSQGLYDKQRFMTYIRLPRNVSYLPQVVLDDADQRRFLADLNADFRSLTLYPPVGSDDQLVRDYLRHYFIEENSTKPYEQFIRDTFLRQVFAETKIVNGLGNPEQWYSLLPPEQYQALKERIDLEFAPTNKELFAVDAPVSMDLYVKNVRILIVKVFEVNTRNFYQQNLREVNTDINLDGLVANDEQTFNYDESPLRRVKRHFEFPSLTRPGVYVVDFIGNGMSSRAVIRIGTLRHLVRNSTAGHIFTILDEKHQQVGDASLWLAGHEYRPGEDGCIVVPYTTKPGRQVIVLSRRTLSCLESFEHLPEEYAFTAGIYVDRESLLARREAKVIIRPALYVNGTPVTLTVLEDTKLRITSTDLDGVSIVKEIAPFPLREDQELIYEFHVPARLAQLDFTLSAKVQNLSQNKKIDLSTSESFTLNSIDTTDNVQDLHLAEFNGLHVLELLGKTGEPKPDRAVSLQLKHRDFRAPVSVSLKTDAQGRIHLGRLPDIDVVTATVGEATHAWPLVRHRHTYHQSVHAPAGGSIEVPLGDHSLHPGIAGNANEPARPDRSEVSLLELRGGTFVADRFENLAVEDGMLIARNLAPGDYSLYLKRNDRHLVLRFTRGELREGWVLGENRHLEVRGQKPLHIADVQTDNQSVKVRLRNASKFTRVHIFAVRYEPNYDLFARLANVMDAEPYLANLAKPEARYMSGRNIGDEYRYILERRVAARYPGVMLERPGVLLNPWAIRTTQTGQQEAKSGEAFAPAAPPPAAEMNREDAAAMDRPAHPQPPLTSNLDFLGETAAVMANLRPDENGIVVLDRKVLGAHSLLRVVAVDPLTTACREVSLPEQEMTFRDLRLTKGLPPDKHFTQQKKITHVKAGDAFTLADITTSRFEAYDSVARLYSLYMTLSRDPKLAEFHFIAQWPTRKPEEKREMYSKYACHELNFFLFQRDPEFFQLVVKPYLANKKDKTFLDRWLLEEPVDEFLNPWHYKRLNIVERILLARRLAADREHGMRHVKDSYALLPPDIERLNALFRTAIRGSDLESTNLELLVPQLRRQELQLAEAAAEEAEALGAERVAGGLPGPAGRGRAFGMAQISDMDKRNLAEGARNQSRSVELDSKAYDATLEKGRVEFLRNAAPQADDYAFRMDRLARDTAAKFFQQLDKTREWAENNYYHLPIDQQNAELVTVNSFWRDLAAHSSEKMDRFYPTTLAEPSRNFTEMMFALALIDLPFEPGKHESKFADLAMSLKAASPMIVFHEEIREAGPAGDQKLILVSQNFFNAHDRYQFVNNEQLDKFVGEEFLVHTVYGCQIVVTNPTSTPQKLDVLTQIPVGAIVLRGGEATRSSHVQLQPFSTVTVEYYFYFPAAGKYPHYPVHVAKNEQLLASVEPVVFHVVEQLSNVDRESWQYISQLGTNDDVLDYLRQANLHRLQLDKIAFRMHDPKFFAAVVELLGQRHAYEHTLWSYGLKHNHLGAIREFLQHNDSLIEQIGEWLDSRPLTIDPVARQAYQHLEYLPLVNARSHQLGRRRQILNEGLTQQYHRLLKVLAYKRTFSNEDRLAITYYLLIQDRIAEAVEYFDAVNADQLDSRLQYDYLAAYLNLYQEDLAAAEQIAARYARYPVDRWRNLFVAMKTQIDEAKGGNTEVSDPEDRGQVQTRLASTEPSFEFQVESRKVTIHYQNLKQVRVNYYLMDIELLFSRNPFVQTHEQQFAHIRPNLTQAVDLPAETGSFAFVLPEELHKSNVLVEISGGASTKTQPYYANSMALQLTENYGQLRVVTANPGKPVPKVYVKVYARMKDGTVRFFKDGYTDMRGRFDYASLSTNELDHVDKLSLLVLSEEHGAVVMEASPPKQ